MLSAASTASMMGRQQLDQNSQAYKKYEDVN
jgi:hypothetical protein